MRSIFERAQSAADINNQLSADLTAYFCQDKTIYCTALMLVFDLWKSGPEKKIVDICEECYRIWIDEHNDL